MDKTIILTIAKWDDLELQDEYNDILLKEEIEELVGDL